MASKPALRNLLLNQTKRDFVVASVVAVIFAGAYKIGVEKQRRKTIDDFMNTYDANAAYERMKAAGVFKYYKGEE